MLLNKLYREFIPVFVRKKLYPFVHPLNTYVAYVVKKKAKQRVISGPFKGMKLNPDNLYFPMLLGTFELEIRPAFDKLVNCRFDQIINGGAAEGYYAVGMALRWPEASVYAFETKIDLYCTTILRLAKENSVSDRVHIRGHCSPAELANLLTTDKSTLLMLDVEGDEVKLLDPVSINGLLQATIIVELHDMVIPGCSGIIEERFKNTHNIEKYTTCPRGLEYFPFQLGPVVEFFTRGNIVRIMDEGRLAQQVYFLMIPKKRK